MNDKKLRILLGDDHAVLRAGLIIFLNMEPDMEVVGEAEDGEEVLQKINKLSPDLLLLDLSMPNLSGAECIEKITYKYPNVKILVLTMHDDEEHLKAVLRAGAKGYILKRATAEELLSAIRIIAKGEMYVYPTMAANLVYDQLCGSNQDSKSESKKIKSLSERELEVLRYLALGCTNWEVAKKLHLSVKTVETYRSRLVDKLGIRHRTELVQLAQRHGILDE